MHICLLYGCLIISDAIVSLGDFNCGTNGI